MKKKNKVNPSLKRVKPRLFQTASGSVPAPLYTELLAAYLADGELIRWAVLRNLPKKD